jgi:hypothetical protein
MKYLKKFNEDFNHLEGKDFYFKQIPVHDFVGKHPEECSKRDIDYILGLFKDKQVIGQSTSGNRVQVSYDENVNIERFLNQKGTDVKSKIFYSLSKFDDDWWKVQFNIIPNKLNMVTSLYICDGYEGIQKLVEYFNEKMRIN